MRLGWFLLRDVVFVPKLKGRKKIGLLNGTLSFNIQVKIRDLMVNGSWIQNVWTLKMKSLMFNFLQPLLGIASKKKKINFFILLTYSCSPTHVHVHMFTK